MKDAGATAGRRRRGYVGTVAAQLAGRSVNMAANLGSLALIARVLPEDEFGLYVLVTGLAVMLSQVADFGTGPVFGQHVGTLAPAAPETGVRLPGGDWGSFLLLRAALAVAATALGLGVALQLGGPAARPMLLASLSIPFIAARCLDPLYQVAGRPFRSTATQLVSAGSFLGGVALAAALHLSLTWFLVVFVASNLAYTLGAWLAARDLIARPVRLDRPAMRRMITLAAPIGVSGLMMAVNGRANLIFLNHFEGAGELAVYGAATRVLDVAVAFAVVVLWPLIPMLSRSAQDGVAALAGEMRGAIRLLLQLLLPLLVAAPYLAPMIVQLLYGDRYRAAAPVLSVLALVGFGVVFSLLASYALLALRISRYSIWIAGTGTAANLLLNVALVPGQGAIGAAIAAACSEAVLASLVMITLVRHVPRAIDWRSTLALFAMAGLGAAALAMAVPRTTPALALLPPLLSGLLLVRLLRRQRRMMGTAALPTGGI